MNEISYLISFVIGVVLGYSFSLMNHPQEKHEFKDYYDYMTYRQETKENRK